MAIGFGDSLGSRCRSCRSRLTAESLAATAPAAEAEDVQRGRRRAAGAYQPGPAAEWLREQTLDQLGARTTLVDGEPIGPARRRRRELASTHPSRRCRSGRPARSSPSRTSGRRTSSPIRFLVRRLLTLATRCWRDGVDGSSARAVPAAGGRLEETSSGFSAFGLSLAGAGLFLVLGGGLAGWRRKDLQMALLPAVIPSRVALHGSLDRSGCRRRRALDRPPAPTPLGAEDRWGVPRPALSL